MPIFVYLTATLLFIILILPCQAGIIDRYNQDFPTTRFEPDGTLYGNEYFGNAVDLLTYGGSSCFKQGCRILSNPYSSNNNNNNTNTNINSKIILNITTNKNIESCFDMCLETNKTNLIQNSIPTERLSCEWNRIDKICSVSNVENVYCWNGINYTDYYTYINAPNIPCTSKSLCSNNNSNYFSFQYSKESNNNNNNHGNVHKRCDIRSRNELLLIGAKNDGVSNTIQNSGASSLYIRKPFTNGTWELVDTVKPNGVDSLLQNDNYGASVHIFNKEYIFISATHDDIPGHTNQYNTGVVYFFKVNYELKSTSADGTYNNEISSINIIENQKIYSPLLIEQEFFGSAIGSDGQQWLAVASLGKSPSPGSVYVYKLNITNTTNPQFTYFQTLTVNETTATIHFGKSISISGKTMVIGADAENVGSKLNQGCVYIYELNNNTSWVLKDKITPNDGAANDFFGFSVSLNNDDQLLIGAHHDDNIKGGVNPGSVYYYERVYMSSSWIEKQKIVLPASDTDNYFGVSISHSRFGENVAIGATGDISKNGSVYIYTYDRAQNQYVKMKKITHSNATMVDYHRFGSALKFSNNMIVVGAELNNNVLHNKANTGMVDLFNFKPTSPSSQSIKSFNVVNTYIEIEIIPLDTTTSYQPVIEYVATTGQNGCELQQSGNCWKRHFSTKSSTLNINNRRYYNSNNPLCNECDNYTKSLVEQNNINYTLILNMTNLMNGEPYYISMGARSKYGCGPSTNFYGPFIPAQRPNQIVNLVAVPDDRTLDVTAPIPTWNGGAAITLYTAILSPRGTILTNAVEPKFQFVGLDNGVSYSVKMYATNWAGDSYLSSASNSVVPAEIPGSPILRTSTVEDSGFIVYYDKPLWDGGGDILYYLLIVFLDGNGIILGNSTDTKTSIRVRNLVNSIPYNVTIQAVNWQGGGNYSEFIQLRPMAPPESPVISDELTFASYALIVLVSLLVVGTAIAIIKNQCDKIAEKKRLMKVAPLVNNRKYFTD